MSWLGPKVLSNRSQRANVIIADDGEHAHGLFFPQCTNVRIQGGGMRGLIHTRTHERDPNPVGPGRGLRRRQFFGAAVAENPLARRVVQERALEALCRPKRLKQ